MEEMSSFRVQVEFSGISRVLTGQSEYSLDLKAGADVGEVVRLLAKKFPELVGEVIEKDGQALIPSNLFSVNGEKILHESDLQYQPREGDRLILLSLLSGG